MKHKAQCDLRGLAAHLHRLTGSTDITVRHSISIDTQGNLNEKVSIFHNHRWVHGKSIEEVITNKGNSEMIITMKLAGVRLQER